MESEKKNLEAKKETAVQNQNTAEKNFDDASIKKKRMEEDLYGSDANGNPQVDVHGKQKAQMEADDNLHQANKDLENKTKAKEKADAELDEARNKGMTKEESSELNELETKKKKSQQEIDQKKQELENADTPEKKAEIQSEIDSKQAEMDKHNEQINNKKNEIDERLSDDPDYSSKKTNSNDANKNFDDSKTKHGEATNAKAQADTDLGDEITKRNKIHAEENIDMAEIELKNIESEMDLRTQNKQGKADGKAEKKADGKAEKKAEGEPKTDFETKHNEIMESEDYLISGENKLKKKKRELEDAKRNNPGGDHKSLEREIRGQERENRKAKELLEKKKQKLNEDYNKLESGSHKEFESIMGKPRDIDEVKFNELDTKAKNKTLTIEERRDYEHHINKKKIKAREDIINKDITPETNLDALEKSLDIEIERISEQIPKRTTKTEKVKGLVSDTPNEKKLKELKLKQKKLKKIQTKLPKVEGELSQLNIFKRQEIMKKKKRLLFFDNKHFLGDDITKLDNIGKLKIDEADDLIKKFNKQSKLTKVEEEILSDLKGRRIEILKEKNIGITSDDLKHYNSSETEKILDDLISKAGDENKELLMKKKNKIMIEKQIEIEKEKTKFGKTATHQRLEKELEISDLQDKLKLTPQDPNTDAIRREIKQKKLELKKQENLLSRFEKEELKKLQSKDYGNLKNELHSLDETKLDNIEKNLSKLEKQGIDVKLERYEYEIKRHNLEVEKNVKKIDEIGEATTKDLEKLAEELGIPPPPEIEKKDFIEKIEKKIKLTPEQKESFNFYGDNPIGWEYVAKKKLDIDIPIREEYMKEYMKKQIGEKKTPFNIRDGTKQELIKSHPEMKIQIEQEFKFRDSISQETKQSYNPFEGAKKDLSEHQNYLKARKTELKDSIEEFNKKREEIIKKYKGQANKSSRKDKLEELTTKLFNEFEDLGFEKSLLDTTNHKNVASKLQNKLDGSIKEVEKTLEETGKSFNSYKVGQNLENMDLSELNALEKTNRKLLPETREELRRIRDKKIAKISSETPAEKIEMLKEKRNKLNKLSGEAAGDVKREIRNLEEELKVIKKNNPSEYTEFLQKENSNFEIKNKLSSKGTNLNSEITLNNSRIVDLKARGNLSGTEKIELDALERKTEMLNRQMDIMNRNQVQDKLLLDLTLETDKNKIKKIKEEIFNHRSLNLEDSTKNLLEDLKNKKFTDSKLLETDIYQTFNETLKSNPVLSEEFKKIQTLDLSNPSSVERVEQLLEDCRKLQHTDLENIKDIKDIKDIRGLRQSISKNIKENKLNIQGPKMNNVKRLSDDSKIIKLSEQDEAEMFSDMYDFRTAFIEASRIKREKRIKEEEKKSLKLIDKEMERYNMTGSKSITLQKLKFLQTPMISSKFKTKIQYSKTKENTFTDEPGVVKGGGKRTKKNLGNFERKIQKEILKLDVKIPKTPRQKQRDLELEAMVNIKYRHKISEKVNLSNQELLLDKVLKVFDDKIDKNDTYIKEIKKISEDKKVNYFRYILLEVGNNLIDLISGSFELFKNSLMLHVYIREVNTSYYQKDIEFKKKYETVKSKDEFGIFVEEMNRLMIEEELLFREVKKNRIKLEKTEVEYKVFQKIKREFEKKQNELLEYKNEMKKSKDSQIKEYLKLYEEVRNLKKKEEELYLYLELIQKNILNYQSKLDMKVKYFVRIQELCKEEIVYIKNEFALAEFLKLNLEKKNKIKLFGMLNEIHTYFKDLITGLNKFNDIIKETLIPILDNETETINEEKIFIQETLDKIKIETDKNEFIYRMSSKEKLFTIFSNLDFNIRAELNYNDEMINNCQDFMSSIDYEINYIDTEYIHRKIEHKTKRKRGLIDTNNINQIINSKSKKKKKTNNIIIRKKKLINILTEVSTLLTRKKISKRRLKKKQNKNMQNIDKLVNDINELDANMTDASNVYSKKKLEELRRIKNTKKNSIKRMSNLSKKYKNMKDPMELLLQKNILTKKKKRYYFNKKFLKKNGVKILPIMTKKLKNINANMIRINRIDTNTTYYSNSKNEI